MFRSAAVFFAVCVTISPAFSQRNLRDIPDPDPEAQRQTFRLPDGWEVQLFASEPQIAKPIQMNFDAAGKLWVASSTSYPHPEPGEIPNDKIIVLEDTDGDGRADRSEVFAEGLNIPTGVIPGDGGVYVANSTELLHLTDTDGDGKSDRSRIVLSGFGTEDTHHLLHTLRWGPAGRLYLNQSIYIHSHIETPHGIRRLNGGGIWRFDTRTQKLNVYIRGLINPWGHRFDQFGQSFATDGAGGEGINYCLPGAAYRTARNAGKILPGLNPGSPKYCGLEILSGDHIPEEWTGQMLTNDFRGHRVCRFEVTPSGSGYVSRELPPLITSNHVAFRPVDIAVGPDGAIYIADWYNPIIQHGEVDFRDPRRDRVHGRIWRVTRTGVPTAENPNLPEKSHSELIGLLTDSSGWVREQSRRTLTERGPDAVLPELRIAIARELDAETPDDWRLLQFLWVAHSFEAAPDDLLRRVLQSDEPKIRAAAVRVLGDRLEPASPPPASLIKAADDDHPQVRLEAVRAVAGSRTVEAVETVLDIAAQPTDRFLDYAIWLSLTELAPVWEGSLKADPSRLLGGDLDRVVLLARTVPSRTLTTELHRLLLAGKIEADDRDAVIGVLIETGGATEWETVLQQLTDRTPQARRALLGSLVNKAMRSNIRPRGELGSLPVLLDSNDPADRTAALKLIGRWRVEPLRDRAGRFALDPKRPRAERRTAFGAIADLGGNGSLSFFRKVAESDANRETRIDAIAAWSRLNPKVAAEFAIALLSEPLPAAETTSLISPFLRQKDGGQHLIAALADRSISSENARAALEVVASSGSRDKSLSDAITRAGRVRSTARDWNDDRIDAFLKSVRELGDAERGELVYRRETMNCTGCHAIGPAGGKVGPNLLSLGGSSQPDYILESLLKPNAKVKEGYGTLSVVTEEGKLINGILVRETETELIMRDEKDREVTIPRDSIEEAAPGLSLMPKGLVDRLSDEELRDLTRFLSELGRTPDYTVSPEPIVRRWDVMLDTQAARVHLRRTSDARATSDDEQFAWKRVYSTVAGKLPLQEIPVVRTTGKVAGEPRPVRFARFTISATEPGRLRLTLGDPAGLRAWLNGTPISDFDEAVDVPVGTHRVTIAIDDPRREKPLRVILHPDSERVTLVGGK